MPESQQIVVGVDGSPASDAALRWACDEAALRGAGVVVLHVVSIPYELPRVPIDEPQTDMEREGKRVLDEALARVAADGVSVEPRLLEGSPGELLVEASEDAALVVVGTRAHGRLASFVVGSVSSTVVHHAACPVVVVRG
ncbi:MAG TPA: universal stress protein [Acidimicrobiia bacterium]